VSIKGGDSVSTEIFCRNFCL